MLLFIENSVKMSVQCTEYMSTEMIIIYSVPLGIQTSFRINYNLLILTQEFSDKKSECTEGYTRDVTLVLYRVDDSGLDTDLYSEGGDGLDALHLVSMQMLSLYMEHG